MKISHVDKYTVEVRHYLYRDTVWIVTATVAVYDTHKQLLCLDLNDIDDVEVQAMAKQDAFEELRRDGVYCPAI